MAIYHHSTKIIARSAGKSAVAAAAYRSGTKLCDERTGITHDYTRKTGVDHSVILSPKNADWIFDRQKLWDEVERSEKRINSQVAREVEIAIPIELDRESKIKLVAEYIQQNYVNLGMIADVNYHNLDGRNPHAHIMLTMRELEVSQDGSIEFSAKKNRDWNSTDLLIKNRESWAKIANQYLANAGYADVKIDHRSNADRGIETIPQIHLGAAVIAMQKKGIPTERGDEYDWIDLVNINVRDKLEEIFASESGTRDLERQLAEFDCQVSKPVSDQEQKLKDRDVFASVRANPYLRQTKEYQEAIFRKNSRFYPNIEKPKKVIKPTPEPAVERITLYQKTDPLLIRSIIATGNRLGTDCYQAGDYQVQISPKQIDVRYNNNLAVIIGMSTGLSMLIDRDRSFTLKQYEQDLQRLIDVLVTNLEQQREQEQEQPPQAEPEPELAPQIIIEESEIEIKILCAKTRQQNDRGGIGN